jgi:transcriptional regulator with XRE-family HTH domain
MPYNNSINARIKARIEEMGMQQVELAKRVGVSKTAVSLWINETTKFIRPEHLVKIADALGLEIRYLITGQGPRLAKNDPPIDFDNQDMELLRAPPEVKAIFRAILSTTHKQP